MPSIAAVLIAKNEEVLLDRCLSSLKGLDAIYITDTGSTDKTVEIARRYTDKVTFREWDDSFCRARNFAKKDVKEDWILSVDADEFLHSVEDVRKTVEEAERQKALAVDVNMIAEDGKNVFEFPRLFKNSPQVWWNGDIHNHLSVHGEKIGKVEITFGYSPAHHSDPDRALRILKKVTESESAGARDFYYLGREYFYKHDFENAVLTLGKYIQKSVFAGEKADAFLIMGRSYWEMKMGDDAKDACLQAIKINPNFREACRFMADLCRKDTHLPNWESNVKQWERMTENGDNSGVLFIRTLD